MRQSLINLYARCFNLLPEKLQDPINGARNIPSFLTWNLSPIGFKHARNILAPYHNCYKGFRCVVIGNGPSLNKMNLGLLRDEFTFGLNRIYLLFDQIGFETTFLVSVNGLVIKQFASEISKVNSLKFIHWGYHKFVENNDNTIFICPRTLYKNFDGNVLQGISPTYGTVTNIALELAYFMGFSEVILIGVDHNFVDKGAPGKAIVAQNNDQNHFSKDYFGKGIVWQLPNFQTSEKGYERNKNLFESNGRQIVDATIDGKLDIFPKVDFEFYLRNSRYKNKPSTES